MQKDIPFKYFGGHRTILKQIRAGTKGQQLDGRKNKNHMAKNIYYAKKYGQQSCTKCIMFSINASKVSCIAIMHQVVDIWIFFICRPSQGAGLRLLYACSFEIDQRVQGISEGVSSSLVYITKVNLLKVILRACLARYKRLY